MSCENSTVQTLKESGHRLTPQRLMIVSAVRHEPTHITASQVLKRVQESYPYLDISTVYRTLGVLKQIRLVSETDMRDGEYKYEWIEKIRHHHLICRMCDRVTLLDDKYLVSLGTETMDEYGFEADIDHFAIFGICKECRNKTQSV